MCQPRLSLITLLVFACMASAQTATVYKHVDKDGKVTYSEKPPAKPDPKADIKAPPGAKKIEMDNERNVIKSFTPKSNSDGAADVRSFDKRIEKNDSLRAELDEALRELDEAKAALEAGKDPLEDEWQTIGAGQGRVSRVPTDAYHQRVKSLEKSVEDAAAKVKRAENAVRRGTS